MASRIILVDALAFVYRAYYAVKGLATADGRPTNAVFGFIKMLSQINRFWQPTHELVVFDGGLPEERRRLLAAYKAQRPPMPEPLRAQLSGIEEYLDAAMIKRVRMDGVEADDIIAAVAAAASKEMETLVASSDKDLMQLAGGRITLVAPGNIEARIGPEEVCLKTGVKPEQIVEWLAMVGDSSDNIPGVPGIGAKTSARLLREWGSLRAIFDNLEKIEPEKTRRALREHQPDALRNVLLITLDKGIPLPCGLEDMKIGAPETGRLRSFFSKMEFHSLAAGLQSI